MSVHQPDGMYLSGAAFVSRIDQAVIFRDFFWAILGIALYLFMGYSQAVRATVSYTDGHSREAVRVLFGFRVLAAGVLFGAQILSTAGRSLRPRPGQLPRPQGRRRQRLRPRRALPRARSHVSPRLPAFATEVVAPRAASPLADLPRLPVHPSRRRHRPRPRHLRPLRRSRCPRLNPRSRLGPWWSASMPAAFPAKSALLNRVTMRRAASSCAACKPRCGGSDAMKASCLASGRPAPNARWAPLSRV